MASSSSRAVLRIPAVTLTSALRLQVAGVAQLAPRAALVASLHTTAVRRNASADILGQLKGGLKEAMKAKDSFKSTVIRSLLSEQQYAEKEGTTGGISGILQKAVARRQESARQFRAAKPPREDLAEKEDREAAMIQAFLPEQISSSELEDVVRKAIDEAQKAGIEGKRLMGDVMKRVGQQVDKARAPGSVVSETVRRLLG